MTDLEQSQRDAAHARDQLIQARLLLVRCETNMKVDTALHGRSAEREAAIAAVAVFMASTSLYPKADQ